METPDSDGYVSVGLLARGGMGEVHLGLRQQGSFRRLVAIKRLRPQHRDDTDFRRMFLDEARLAGLVRHPNVVSVLDVGEDRNGPYLVMDFVEGITVHQLLVELGARSLLLPLQVAVRIAHHIASGLAAVHELRATDGSELGLIHRDVSPQNVLVGFDGTARVADFGIAKAVDSQRTTTGILKGKIGYMSPEQLSFQRPSQKTDLFSLGVVLFELIAGRRLYKGQDAVETAQSILNAPPPDLYVAREEAPPELVELSFELLAKTPESRPASAREVAKRLDDVLEELVALEGALRIDEYLEQQFGEAARSLKERSETLVTDWEHSRVLARTARTRRRRRGILVGAAAAGLAIGAGAFLAVTWRGEAPSPPSNAAPASAIEQGPSERTIPINEGETSERIAGAGDDGARLEEGGSGSGDALTEAAVEAASRTDEAALDEGARPEADPELAAIEPSPRTRRARRRRRRRPSPAEPEPEFRAIDLIRGQR